MRGITQSTKDSSRTSNQRVGYLDLAKNCKLSIVSWMSLREFQAVTCMSASNTVAFNNGMTRQEYWQEMYDSLFHSMNCFFCDFVFKFFRI